MFKKKFENCIQLFNSGDLFNASIAARNLINECPENY